MRLVDERLVVGDVEAAVALPVEERRDHDALLHVRRGVVVVARVGVAEVVAEQRLVPLDLAAGRLGVGVDQQLVRVAAQALGRVVRAVHAVAVALAGLHGGQVAVPDVGVDLGQLDPGLLAVLVEQAQLHAVGHLAEEREVRAAPVERRAQRVCRSRPGLHHGVLLVHATAHRTALLSSQHDGTHGLDRSNNSVRAPCVTPGVAAVGAGRPLPDGRVGPMKRTIYDEDHEAFRASVSEFLDRSVVPHVERARRREGAARASSGSRPASRASSASRSPSSTAARGGAATTGSTRCSSRSSPRSTPRSPRAWASTPTSSRRTSSS